MSDSKRNGKKSVTTTTVVRRGKGNASARVGKRTVRNRKSQSQNPPRPRGGGQVRGRGSSRGITSAPSAIGMTAPRSHFSFTGGAQKLADQDSGSSLRIQGTDLFFQPIQAGSTDAKAGFGGTATYWAVLTPTAISTRIASVEKMFQWYVIRRLKITYTPTIGTGTAGSLSVGVSTDAQLNTAFATPTQQQVLELNPSLLSPVWAMSTLELKNTGTKLYECYRGSTTETSNETTQALLACTLLGGVASTTYGQFWLEYVIDFYQPTPILPSAQFKLPPLTFRSSPPLEEKKEDAKFSSTQPGLSPIDTEFDGDFPVPPRFHPDTSSVPGSRGYTAPSKKTSQK